MNDKIDVLIKIRETYKYKQETREWIDHEIDQLITSELRQSRVERKTKSIDDIRVFQILEWANHAMNVTEISEIAGFSPQKTWVITRRLYTLGLLERETYKYI